MNSRSSSKGCRGHSRMPASQQARRSRADGTCHLTEHDVSSAKWPLSCWCVRWFSRAEISFSVSQVSVQRQTGDKM